MAALTLELASGGKGGSDSPLRPTADDDRFYDGSDPVERVRRAMAAISGFGDHIVNPGVDVELVDSLPINPSRVVYRGIRRAAEQ